MQRCLKNHINYLLGSGILAVVLFSSCQKENPQIVPTVAVDIRIYSSDPNFINLNAVGGWIYYPGGNRGIVICRTTLSDFVAYDRTCTYKPTDPNELVKVDASNVILVDAHCGSKFLLNTGGVTQGPATLSLKSYQTTYDGTVLHIFN
jgi:hypothetical protein